MKFKKYFFILFFILFKSAYASTINLEKNSISLKDFLFLKLDLFLQQNIVNMFRGGGITNVKYQSIDYDLNIDKQDNIFIKMNAVMDKKRYNAKKYYPKLRDCTQMRNKIFTNNFGYSFFTQKKNNLVNEVSLTEAINEKILNISSIDEGFKLKIIDRMQIQIEIIHPLANKSISCSGKLIDSELK